MEERKMVNYLTMQYCDGDMSVQYKRMDIILHGTSFVSSQLGWWMIKAIMAAAANFFVLAFFTLEKFTEQLWFYTFLYSHRTTVQYLMSAWR